MRRLIAAAGLLVLLSTSTAVASPNETVLVTRASNGEKVRSEFGATNASISADGRYVAFETDAGNLIRGDRHPDYDVFVHDRKTGKTVLASRANGRNGHLGYDGSGDADISPDGHFVAFDGARDLHPEAPRSFSPIYLRDMAKGRLLLISRASGAHGRVQNNASYNPVVSRDGRFVAYHAEATNLDPADRNAKPDVYVRDVKRNRTLLVSRASGAKGEKGNGISTDASISDDGRYIAFSSRAHNFDPDDTVNDRDIYVRDLRTNRTLLASPGTDGPATKPSISADGRFVAYEHAAAVYLRDLTTRTTQLVSAGNGAASEPAVSGDGRLVSYESYATDLDPADPDEDADTYVRDMVSGTTRLVTRATGPNGPKAAGTDRGYASGWISSDGSAVVFETNHHNLDPDDTDEEGDIYVRDL
jgi:Tol biopolymer transport system component